MSFSVVLFRSLVAELDARGVDADALLRRSHLDRERLLDLRHMVSVADANAFVRGAIELTREPALGLLSARHAPPSVLQAVGYLSLSQPTLRAALQVLVEYGELLADGASFTLQEHGERVTLRCTTAVPGEAMRAFAELALVMVMRIANHFAGNEVQVDDVSLQHAESCERTRYLEVFGCAPRFEQAYYAVRFERTHLDVTQPHADKLVAQALQGVVTRLRNERALSLSLVERVLAILSYHTDWDKVDSGEVALRLGLTPRALRRRLAEEGSSLTLLIDETRCRLACDELRSPGTCIKDISHRMGFSEPSAFHRAFRRWTGQTPLAYRKSARTSLRSERPYVGELPRSRVA